MDATAWTLRGSSGAARLERSSGGCEGADVLLLRRNLQSRAFVAADVPSRVTRRAPGSGDRPADGATLVGT